MKSLREEIKHVLDNSKVEYNPKSRTTTLTKLLKGSIDWYYISRYQKLSEGFIREFKGSVNWYRISEYQKLSEGFIREFKGSVDWYHISIYQKLSEGFIREFKTDREFDQT